MNKLHRRIQRNQRRYVTTLCATILTSKHSIHKRLPWTQHMTKEQYHEYSTSQERIRDRIYDKLRNEWYTKFAQTPLQMAHELPKQRASKIYKIARFIYSREYDETIRYSAARDQNRPWGNYFSVKFPMVLFNCGVNVNNEDLLYKEESHYVDWQDQRYKGMYPNG